MVVSEIGEQWSPKTAPASTELITPFRMMVMSALESAASMPSVLASGITRGIMMAMVPQLVPVAKLTMAAMMNVRTGSQCGSMVPRRI